MHKTASQDQTCQHMPTEGTLKVPHSDFIRVNIWSAGCKPQSVTYVWAILNLEAVVSSCGDLFPFLFYLDRLYWSFDCFGTVNLIISFDVLACNMASNLLNDITTLAMTKCFPGSSKIFISLWTLLICLLTCIYVCECTSINGLICLLINLF